MMSVEGELYLTMSRLIDAFDYNTTKRIVNPI